MRIRSFFITSILSIFLHITAFAGEGGVSGGGGYAVVCYENNEIKSVELLDMYEAKHTFQFAELSGVLEQDLETLAKKLSPEFSETGWDVWTGVILLLKNFKFIPEGTKLTPTNDAFPVFLPKNCKPEQVANYYNHFTLWVDKELYDHLSYRDQVALVMHEFIYMMERSFGAKDSRYTRRVVGALMSTKEFINPYENTEKAAFSCRTLTEKRTEFYVIKNPSGKESDLWTFQFTTLNGRRVYSKKTAQLLFPKKTPNSDEVSIPPFSSSIMESLIDSNETISTTLDTNRKPILTWNGTDPGDFFSVSYKCGPLSF